MCVCRRRSAEPADAGAPAPAAAEGGAAEPASQQGKADAQAAEHARVVRYKEKAEAAEARAKELEAKLEAQDKGNAGVAALEGQKAIMA